VRIEVEPDVLINAGQRMESLGSQLGMLSDALGAALGSGIASGTDPAGLDFGLKYGHQAQEFADTLAKAANSFKSVGCALQATGYNYKNADAASTVGGPGPSGGVSGEPSQTMPAQIPSGPNGAIVPPPPAWWLIQPLLQALPGLGLIACAAMTWPSGHPALLSVLAAQWRNFATAFAIFEPEVNALKTSVGAQIIPEGKQIGLAFDQLGQSMKSMADASSTMAQLITDFASGVQQTQDAIRRLLDRLSFEGLWDTVTGFLTGEGDDILREVARDVGTVLNNFQQQVKGIVGLLGELTALIGDAATTFERWIRPVLVAQFGDDVGNFLADAVTLYTDFEVGLTTGLINTVAGVVSMADIDTWKGMADVALSVAEDPTKLPGVLENMGKEFVAWDKWSGDHPGRAAGEAAFNIGSLFVPGGALSKTGTVAKGLNLSRRMLDEGRLPQFGELGSWSHGTPKLDDVGGGPKLPEIPDVKPNAIPESVIGPTAPNGIDAPSSPRGLEGPAGPPDPPGPTSTPGGPDRHGFDGGGGPPPDPPGRSVGPPESGPASVDGPSPQSPGPSPVDRQRFSEPTAPSHAPSAGDQTPPATQHVHESSSPAGQPDAGRPPSEPGPPSAEHAPTAPEASGNGHAAEQHGSGSGAGEDAGYRHADTNGAPSESYRPGSEDYSGRPEGPTHTPADHQPAHTPATEQPSGHERPATDGSQNGEQPQISSDGDGQRQEPAGTTPSATAGTAMPMAPHGYGATHSAADGQASAARTNTPETTARNADTRFPHTTSPESPRAQPHASAGPASENSPAAPVAPAAAHPASSAAGEPMRPGPEPHTQRPDDGKRDSSAAPHPVTHSDGSTRDGSRQEPHPVHAGLHDEHPGSAWDGPTGQHAAQLLPADDSGYRVQPRDCEFLGISPEQVEAWANREAPLGMTPTEFREFSRSLYDAMAREGFTPEDLDLRLQGSSARFFSGEHKSLELDSDDPEVQARIDTWFGDDANRPLRRPFDSMYRLGLDPEPSDYDIQISSDAMVDACRQRWEADGSQGDLVHPKYGFISKKVFEKMFPGLWEWAEQWSERTGRPVVPALFSSTGPPDTSFAGISSHFRDADWRIQPEGSNPHDA
jgi:hypothetical protein